MPVVLPGCISVAMATEMGVELPSTRGGLQQDAKKVEAVVCFFCVQRERDCFCEGVYV